MPFMGGMEATEHIRAYEMQHGLDPIPIIALTAHASTLRHTMTRFPISHNYPSDRRSREVLAGGHG
jgi:CheY-like chemotaxis protein